MSLMSDIGEILAERGEPMTANQIRSALGAGVAKKAVNAALYAGGFAKVPDASPPKWRVGEPGGGGAAADPSDGCVRRPAFPSAMGEEYSFDGMTVTVVGARVPEDSLPALLVKLSKATKVVAVGPVAGQLEAWSSFLGAAVETPELESWEAAVAFARAAPKGDDEGAAGTAIVYTGGTDPLIWLIVNAFDLEGVVAHGL